MKVVVTQSAFADLESIREYYSEEGGRVTKVFFHEEDGVLIKVVDDRTIIYMKKMPY